MDAPLLRPMKDLDVSTLESLRAELDAELVARDRPPEPPRVGRAPCPARAFIVPDDVKHLDSVRLDELTFTFKKWFDRAKTPAHKRSRGRVWLVFLLLRYTGMRLGEALAIDDRTDFDFQRSMVVIRGEPDREVPLPENVAQEIALFLDEPMNVSLRGQVFRLDQGFIRRKFYERAKECSIPKELLNPRVIRHSRAVELLRGGAPLPVVQGVLGHQSAGLTANYVHFTDGDARRIIQHYVQKEMKMKTSARNSFHGKVTAVRGDALLSEVELTTASGLKIVSVITNESKTSLGVAEGVNLAATIKAPWVILVKDASRFATSARNTFSGVISSIAAGDVAAEVIVDLPDGTKVVALVTDESVKGMGLKVGDDICALVKSFSVILNAE